MNHRELIQSAGKKARFGFLTLPEDLQDEIIDAFDGGTLTLQEASILVKSRGHSLSHEAISGYYRAVRMERRINESKQEIARVIKEFAQRPQKEAVDGLIGLTLALAATGLADGTVGIKDVDLVKLLKEQSGNAQDVAKIEPGKDSKSTAEPGLTGDVAQWIKNEVLGVKKQ